MPGRQVTKTGWRFFHPVFGFVRRSSLILANLKDKRKFARISGVPLLRRLVPEKAQDEKPAQDDEQGRANIA
jgi:hypothetical protein